MRNASSEEQLSNAAPSPDAPREGGNGGGAKRVVRILVTAVLLTYLFLRTNWQAVPEALAQLQLGWLTVAFLVYLSSQVLSSLRWMVLCRGVGIACGFPRLLRLYFEGMFFSLCLPTSFGGDAFKMAAMVEDGRERVVAASTVLADRVSGLIALLGIAAAAWACSYGIAGLGGGIALCLLVTAAITAVSIGLGLLLLGLVDRGLPAGRLRERIQEFGRLAKRPRAFSTAVLCGLGVQGLNVATVCLIGVALGLQVPAGVYAYIVPLVTLLTVIPVSIGGLGVREAALPQLLQSHGVATEQAIALGLLWYAVTFAAGLLGGAVYLLGQPAGMERRLPLYLSAWLRLSNRGVVASAESGKES